MRSCISFLKVPLFALILLCLFSACGTRTPAQTENQLQDQSHMQQVPTSINLVHQTALSGNGCGKVSPITPGTSENITFLSGGIERLVRLHIPTDYKRTVEIPFVLNFHGHSSTAAKQETMTGMSQLANSANFIVAYPQGTIGLDRHTGWNTGPWNYPHVNDVAFTKSIITNVESMFCVNPDRIYAVGFSNGGGFTNVLACKLSNTIAAFGIVSGGMHPVAGGCTPTRPVPIIELHGTADKVVPYRGNPKNDAEPDIPQWLAHWAALDKCSSQPQVFLQQGRYMAERWSSCAGNASIVHYRITGGTHVWPGSIGSHETLDATDVLWNFVSNYRLPSSSSSPMIVKEPPTQNNVLPTITATPAAPPIVKNAQDRAS